MKARLRSSLMPSFARRSRVSENREEVAVKRDNEFPAYRSKNEATCVSVKSEPSSTFGSTDLGNDAFRAIHDLIHLKARNSLANGGSHSFHARIDRGQRFPPADGISSISTDKTRHIAHE
ncbi:hypothetical protein [Bradyrhizobium sp. S3.2.12]|uniref:hypothetical protein n=1 Tax=Bradyrhizobium sp. S3.2.12 TaxID=3156387 RepID=UPI00339115D8